MPLLNMGEGLAVTARLHPDKPGARERPRSMTFRQWDARGGLPTGSWGASSCVCDVVPIHAIMMLGPARCGARRLLISSAPRARTRPIRLLDESGNCQELRIPSSCCALAHVWARLTSLM